MAELEIRINALSDNAVRGINEVERAMTGLRRAAPSADDLRARMDRLDQALRTGSFDKAGQDAQKMGRELERAGQQARVAGQNIERAASQAASSAGQVGQGAARGFAEFGNAARQGVAGLREFSDGLQRIASATVGLFAVQQAIGLIRDLGRTMTETVSSVVAAGDAIDTLRERTGASVQFLSTLKFSAEQTDTSFQALAIGLRRLQVAMVEAAGNADSEAGQAFKAIGVSATDAAGQIRSVESILPSIAEGFRNLKTDAEQTEAAVALFGRSGQELVPFLQTGASGMAELANQAERLGAVMSPGAAKAASEFDNSVKQLNVALDSMKRDIVTPLLGPLNELAQNFIALATASRVLGQEDPGRGFFEGVQRVMVLLPGFRDVLNLTALGYEEIAKKADEARLAMEQATNAQAKSSNIGALRLEEQRRLAPTTDAIDVRAKRPETDDDEITKRLDELIEEARKARIEEQAQTRFAAIEAAKDKGRNAIEIPRHEGRRLVLNDDGSFSTERSITVTDPRINQGRATNIPTLFGGRQVSDEDAISRIAANGGRDPETGRLLESFGSISEASEAAAERSRRLGDELEKLADRFRAQRVQADFLFDQAFGAGQVAGPPSRDSARRRAEEADRENAERAALEAQRGRQALDRAIRSGELAGPPSRDQAMQDAAESAREAQEKLNEELKKQRITVDDLGDAFSELADIAGHLRSRALESVAAIGQLVTRLASLIEQMANLGSATGGGGGGGIIGSIFGALGSALGISGGDGDAEESQGATTPPAEQRPQSAPILVTVKQPQASRPVPVTLPPAERPAPVQNVQRFDEPRPRVTDRPQAQPAQPLVVQVRQAPTRPLPVALPPATTVRAEPPRRPEAPPAPRRPDVPPARPATPVVRVVAPAVQPVQRQGVSDATFRRLDEAIRRIGRGDAPQTPRRVSVSEQVLRPSQAGQRQAAADVARPTRPQAQPLTLLTPREFVDASRRLGRSAGDLARASVSFDRGARLITDSATVADAATDAAGAAGELAEATKLGQRLAAFGKNLLVAIPATIAFGRVLGEVLSQRNARARAGVDAFRGEFARELLTGGSNLSAGIGRGGLEALPRGVQGIRFGTSLGRQFGGITPILFPTPRGGALNIAPSSLPPPVQVPASPMPNPPAPPVPQPTFPRAPVTPGLLPGERDPNLPGRAPAPTEVTVHVQTMDTRGASEFFTSREYQDAQNWAMDVRGGP